MTEPPYASSAEVPSQAALPAAPTPGGDMISPSMERLMYTESRWRALATPKSQFGYGLDRKLSGGVCDVNLTRLSLDEMLEMADAINRATSVVRLRLRCQHWAASDKVSSSLQRKHAKVVKGVANKVEGSMVGTQLSRAVARVVSRAKTLIELELGCSVGRKGLALLAPALSKTSSLRKLSMAGSGIGDSGLKTLLEGLKENAILTELVLSNCGLSDTAADMLGAHIKSHASRYSTLLWQHNLRSYNATKKERRAKAEQAAKADVMMSTGGLVVLDLSDNKITDIGVQCLCSALEHDERMQRLIIKGNKNSKVGEDLLKGLQNVHVPKLQVIVVQPPKDSLLSDKVREARRKMLTSGKKSSSEQGASWKGQWRSIAAPRPQTARPRTATGMKSREVQATKENNKPLRPSSAKAAKKSKTETEKEELQKMITTVTNLLTRYEATVGLPEKKRTPKLRSSPAPAGSRSVAVPSRVSDFANAIAEVYNLDKK